MGSWLLRVRLTARRNAMAGSSQLVARVRSIVLLNLVAKGFVPSLLLARLDHNNFWKDTRARNCILVGCSFPERPRSMFGPIEWGLELAIAIVLQSLSDIFVLSFECGKPRESPLIVTTHPIFPRYPARPREFFTTA